MYFCQPLQLISKEPLFGTENPPYVESAGKLLLSIKCNAEMYPELPFDHFLFISTLQAYPELAMEPLSVTCIWPLPFHFLCLLSEEDVPNPPTLGMLKQVYQLYPGAMETSFFHAVVGLNPDPKVLSWLLELDPKAASMVSPDSRSWPIHLLVRSHFVETEVAVILAKAFHASIRTPIDSNKLSVIQYAIDSRELLADDEHALAKNEETILSLLKIDPDACRVDFQSNVLLPLHELLTGPVTPTLVEAVIKSWPQAVMHLNGHLVRKLGLSRDVKAILKEYYSGSDFDMDFGSVDYTEFCSDSSNDDDDDFMDNCDDSE
jgi:hypothetical protein